MRGLLLFLTAACAGVAAAVVASARAHGDTPDGAERIPGSGAEGAGPDG